MTIHWGLAIIAGLLQGIVEWLPVSSKTMIAIFLAYSGLSVKEAYALGLIANFGSFFAALFYFRRDVLLGVKALAHPFDNSEGAQILRFVFIGTLMTGLVGIPLYITIRHAFSLVGGSMAMVIIGLLLLFTAYITSKKEKLLQNKDLITEKTQKPTTKAAFITGTAQAFAALPGISRSGITMTPLLLMGYNGESALRLSFLLDVVALLGAGVVPLVIGHGGLKAVHALGLGTTVVMVIVAAVVSFFTIGIVLNWAKKLKTSTVTIFIAAVTMLVPILQIMHL